jgi:transcriptional regulator of arginine metabolism
MKKDRQEMILNLIDKYAVTTQAELMGYLKDLGVEVTQATVSRDIRELKLVKQTDENGISRYRQADSLNNKFLKFSAIFSESIISTNCAQNITVVKCHPGTANACCAAIDSMDLEDVAGTIAGDDTIFILCKNERAARDTKRDIESYTKKAT